MGRTACCEKQGLKKGPWTPDEDQKLIAFIVQHGHGNWRALPKKCGLLRCGKSCRLRWTNYLRPDIKRGHFSLSEEQTIIHLHALVGNKWAFIASQLPRRTDNEIKNYWNTVLKKRLQKIGLNNVPHQPKGPDSVSSSESEPSGSALRHLVQWESARLEAEARLARQSKMRATGAWVGITFKTSSSAPSHALQMPLKSQEARFLPNQSSSTVHPMSLASNVEISLQMNQLRRPTAISSTKSSSALSSDSVELCPAKSTSSSAQELNSALKLTSNGSLTWNSHELLPKERATTDSLCFPRFRPDKIGESGGSEPRQLYVLDKPLQSETKVDDQLNLEGGTWQAFSDLHELLFGDDSDSSLSPMPWSQSSSRHDASIQGSGTRMEGVGESEGTMTRAKEVHLGEDKQGNAKVNANSVCEGIDSRGRAESVESLLPEYVDSISEANSSQWDNFLSQLVE